MYDFVNKLRLSKQLLFEEGEITLLGEPTVMMIPQEGFHQMQESLIQQDPLLLYDIGKKSGDKLYTMIGHHTINPKTAAKLGIQLLNVSGYGKFTPINFDLENKRAIFHVEKSINRNMRGAKEPACHYIRGLLAGFMEKLTKEPMECIETKCMATGHTVCEFIIKQKKELNPDAELVKKQIISHKKT